MKNVLFINKCVNGFFHVRYTWTETRCELGDCFGDQSLVLQLLSRFHDPVAEIRQSVSKLRTENEGEDLPNDDSLNEHFSVFIYVLWKKAKFQSPSAKGIRNTNFEDISCLCFCLGLDWRVEHNPNLLRLEPCPTKCQRRLALNSIEAKEK